MAAVRRLTPPPPYTTVATEGTATGQGSTRARAKAAPSGDRQHPKADGVTLLTTTQAWQHCLGLGYQGETVPAFRKWAKRCPADLLRLYGLEATGYQGKDNTAASYRKVR